MQSILMSCCEEKKVVFGFFKDENGLAGKGKAPKGVFLIYLVYYNLYARGNMLCNVKTCFVQCITLRNSN